MVMPWKDILAASSELSGAVQKQIDLFGVNSGGKLEEITRKYDLLTMEPPKVLDSGKHFKLSFNGRFASTTNFAQIVLEAENLGYDVKQELKRYSDNENLFHEIEVFLGESDVMKIYVIAQRRKFGREFDGVLVELSYTTNPEVLAELEGLINKAAGFYGINAAAITTLPSQPV